MREKWCFLLQFLVRWKQRIQGTPPTCSSQHFFSFSILQCKCDRQNTGHPWVLVMWEWGWELFEASLGTILWNKQLIVLLVKTWVVQNVQIMIEMWLWYQCAWCLSCPNLCVPKSRVWDANVGRQGPLIELLSTTSSIRQGGCHLGIVAWCPNKTQS